MARRSGPCLFSLLVCLFVLAPGLVSAKDTPQVARGRYLVTVIGCDDCHTPKLPKSPEPDMSRRLSGHPTGTAAPSEPKPGEFTGALDLTAWYGPWGVSYTANLTPDPETGIGKRYTEASFIKALRTGKKPEGDPILPPMPWPAFQHMTDADLKAIYAFLKTVPPVKNFVRAAKPAAKPAN